MAAARRRAGAPVRCNATLIGRRPGRVAADAERWAARGFSHLQAQARRGRRRRRRCAAVREALGPRARIRVDANGAWDRRRRRNATLAEIEPSRSSWPSSRWRRWRRRWSVAGVDLDPARRRRERRDAGTPSARVAIGGLSADRVKLSKVGGPEAALRDRRDAPRLPLERARRPGRDRRRRARRPSELAASARRRPRTRPRPRHPAPLRRDDRRGRVRARRRPAPPARRARASASRSTRTRSQAHRL